MDGATALAIDLILDGQPIASESVMRAAGAHVVVLSTTLPRPDLPLTLHSTYVGAPGAPTHVIHLQQGPSGRPPHIDGATFGDDADPEHCMVVFAPRDCAYDHAHRLVGWLGELGHQLRVDVTDAAIAALEAIPT
jgi:hypothetical protein